MFVSIKDYAELYKCSISTILKNCKNGEISSAKKVGRNWLIDSDEVYVKYQSLGKTVRVFEKSALDKIPLTEYAKAHNILYKPLQQSAIAGRLKTAKKIGNQWFIDPEEELPYVPRKTVE